MLALGTVIKLVLMLRRCVLAYCCLQLSLVSCIFRGTVVCCAVFACCWLRPHRVTFSVLSATLTYSCCVGASECAGLVVRYDTCACAAHLHGGLHV